VIAGAGLGLAGGYLWDHFLGDSDYTAREAFIDTAGGALGGSVIRPLAKGSSKLGRALWQTSKKGGGAGLASTPAKDLVYASAYAYSRPLMAQTPKYVRGAAAVVGTGYAYDYFKSLESSAMSYQQHGGSGGTPVYSSYGSLPAGTAVHKAGWNPDISDFFRKKGKHHCKKGYTLAKIGGAMMCIKLPRKRKNS